MADVGSIDTVCLSSYFRELQSESKKLDNKLETARIQKKDIQSKASSVLDKNHHLQQKHDNMERVNSVARMKLQESQVQVDHLQKMNDELQKNVDDVKQKIKEEEERKYREMKNFQSQLDELSSRFRNAQTYYREQSLVQEKEKWKKTNDEMNMKVSLNKEVVDKISGNMEKMSLQGTICDEKPVPSTWKQFLECKDSVKHLFQEEGQYWFDILRTLQNKIDNESKTAMEFEVKMKVMEAERRSLMT